MSEDVPIALRVNKASGLTYAGAENVSKISVTLKNLRAERGLTQNQVAAAIQVSSSLIAAFESNRLIPQQDTAKRLDEYFGVGEQFRQMSAEEAEQRQRERAQQPTWFRPWRDAEDSAATLRYFQTNLVPGLLQTEEYARTVLESGLHRRQDIEERVLIRLARQRAVLDRDSPPTCAFVLDAAAVRCGTERMAKEQLSHLLEMSERANIFIRVIPDEVGLHPGRSGSFALATLDLGTVIGYLEDVFEGRVITDPTRVTALDRTWQAVSAVALSCGQSRDLILKMLNEL